MMVIHENKDLFTFNQSNWTESIPPVEELQYYIQERGISPETLQVFIPFIRRVECLYWKPGNTTIAFPYSIPGKELRTGYEIENYHLKRMAVNPNRIEGCWQAKFIDLPILVENAYLFISVIDALSFYEIFNKTIDFNNSVLCSLGSNYNRNQIRHMIRFYTTAKFHLCFPNDFSGNLLDIVTACIKLNREFNFHSHNNSIFLSASSQHYTIRQADFNLSHFEKITRLRANLRSFRAKNAKSFNEMLINNRYQ